MRLNKPTNEFTKKEVKEICDFIHKIAPGLDVCHCSFCKFVDHAFCPLVIGRKKELEKLEYHTLNRN